MAQGRASSWAFFFWSVACGVISVAILDLLFPRRSEKLQTRVMTGVKAWSETTGVIFDRNYSSAGVAVDECEALTISSVFAAAFRLANIRAMLPVGVYRKLPNGRREEQSDHPATRLLGVEPNPESTAFTARHFMQFWKPLFGAECAEIGWDGAGRPRRIWPLEPWRVEPKYDEDNDELYFRVDGKRDVASRDMHYVPHVSRDGVTGVGFVDYAIESLGQAIAADRSAGRFFENDMRPGGILTHPGNPPEPARKKFREEWQANHGGTKNRGKVGVLWGGWQWVKDGGMIDPDKAQLLETRQFSVIEVARWFNIPPHWLAEMGRATWNNVESVGIEALVYTVGPMLTAIEQEYDRKLLDPPRLYSKHNVNALLRADSKTRGEFYRLMREIGVYSADDILDLEDMNGLGGKEGRQRFVPVNWQPADDLMTGNSAQIQLQDAKAPPAPAPVPQPTPNPTPKRAAGMSPAVRGVAEHALGGFARKELNEARRAAKKPGEMMKWMDAFYPDFQSAMMDGLTATGKLVAAVISGNIAGDLGMDLIGVSLQDDVAGRLVSTWVADWVEISKNQLLEAMECKPEEWPHRSTQLFESWELRAKEVATRIGEVTGDAATTT